MLAFSHVMKWCMAPIQYFFLFQITFDIYVDKEIRAMRSQSNSNIILIEQPNKNAPTVITTQTRMFYHLPQTEQQIRLHITYKLFLCEQISINTINMLKFYVSKFLFYYRKLTMIFFFLTICIYFCYWICILLLICKIWNWFIKKIFKWRSENHIKTQIITKIWSNDLAKCLFVFHQSFS